MQSSQATLFELDEIDLAIISALRENARAANNKVAEKVGIAPSTCLARMKSLHDRGVIAGYSVNVNPKALGQNLQALVSVSIRAGARAQISNFADQMRELDEVVQFYFLGGAEDFVLFLSVADTDALREFVVKNLSENPAVASTRTSIVFEAFTH